MNQVYDFLCALVVDDEGRTWDETAEDYQRARVRAILDDSPHAVSQHAVIEPKGSRKTSDAAALAFSLMLNRAPTGARLYGAAADLDQASLLVDSFREFRDRTPGLTGIAVTESKVVVPWRNVEFEALPADTAGAQGLRPYFLVIDELHEWLDSRRVRRFLSNLLAGHDKHHRVDSSARLLVQTNAGSPSSLAGRTHRMATGSRFWQVHELVTPDGVTSPLPWVTVEDLEKAREKADTDVEFRRLHLGLWEDGPDRLATLEDIEACAVLDGEQPPVYGVGYVITVDLSLRRDLSVLAVLHWSGEATFDDAGASVSGPGRLVVDVLRVWKPTKGRDVDLLDVAAHAEDLALRYGAPVYLDSWQAMPLVQSLQRRGVRAEAVQATEASNSRAAVALMALLHDRRISLPKDDDLIQELATVPVQETRPNMWRLGDDRSSGSHHDRVSAIALGALKLEAAVMAAGARMQARRQPVVMSATEFSSWEEQRKLWQPLAEKGVAAAVKWMRAHPPPDLYLQPRGSALRGRR